MPAKDIADSFDVHVNTVRNIIAHYKLPLLRMREVEEVVNTNSRQNIYKYRASTHHSRRTLNKHNIKLSGARIKHYTDAHVIKLLKKKIPHRQIANDLHIAPVTISSIAYKAGFSYKKGPKNTRVYYKIRNQNIIDNTKTLSYNEISEKYGVQTSYISHIVKKNSVR